MKNKLLIILFSLTGIIASLLLFHFETKNSYTIENEIISKDRLLTIDSVLGMYKTSIYTVSSDKLTPAIKSNNLSSSMYLESKISYTRNKEQSYLLNRNDQNDILTTVLMKYR